MLKMKRKTKVVILSRLKEYLGPKALTRYALYALILAAVFVMLCGIVYLSTILVISMFVGRIIATSDVLVLAIFTTFVAGMVIIFARIEHMD